MWLRCAASVSTNVLIGNSRSLSAGNDGINDYRQFLVGTRIEF